MTFVSSQNQNPQTSATGAATPVHTEHLRRPSAFPWKWFFGGCIIGCGVVIITAIFFFSRIMTMLHSFGL